MNAINATLNTSLPANALSDCLGPSFSQLPAIIREAHIGKVHLSGTVEVQRGRGLAGLIALIIGLPDSNNRCRMEVDGDHLPDRMIWSRSFEEVKFQTEFVRDGDSLVEQMGPISLRVMPVVEGGRLHYKLLSASLWKIPLPKWFAPQAIAWEGVEGDLYDFEVDVRLPFIGHLIRYAGKLTLST